MRARTHAHHPVSVAICYLVFLSFYVLLALYNVHRHFAVSLLTFLFPEQIHISPLAHMTSKYSECRNEVGRLLPICIHTSTLLWNRFGQKLMEPTLTSMHIWLKLSLSPARCKPGDLSVCVATTNGNDCNGLRNPLMTLFFFGKFDSNSKSILNIIEVTFAQNIRIFNFSSTFFQIFIQN